MYVVGPSLGALQVGSELKSAQHIDLCIMHMAAGTLVVGWPEARMNLEQRS
jgi:hypothetical protein